MAAAPAISVNAPSLSVILLSRCSSFLSAPLSGLLSQCSSLSVPLSGLLLSPCSPSQCSPSLSVLLSLGAPLDAPLSVPPLNAPSLSQCSSSLGAPLRGQRITVKLRDNLATEDKTCVSSSLGLCWFHGWGDEGNPGQRSVTTRSSQTHDSPSEKVGPFLSQALVLPVAVVG